MQTAAQSTQSGINYRQLNEAEIASTIMRLRDRIQERFPESGLSRVANELITVAREASACIDYIRRPNWPLRVFSAFAIVAMVTILVIGVVVIHPPAEFGDLSDMVRAIEATINDIVFLGVGV